MCEMPQIKAIKKNNNNYDEMFESISDYLSMSDYVVGNLETPISDYMPKTNDLYSFNTPKRILKSLKNNHFDLLVTANNHCLDRGIIGLNETMKNIKKAGLNYVGTSFNGDNSFTVSIKGKKVTFYAYTYGTNYSYNRYTLNDKQQNNVALLKPQKDCNDDYNKIDWFKFMIRQTELYSLLRLIKNTFSKKRVINIDTSIVVDNLNENYWKIDKNYIDSIKNTIKHDDSEYKIFLFHSGGQFNSIPGSFTKSIIDSIIDEDIDAYIGTHPHVVQKCEIYNEKMVAYSLGNLSISPSTVYLDHTLLPDYSIVLNMIIDNNDINYTFSILKAVEDDNHYLRVYLLYDLINQETDYEKKKKLIDDNLFIYNRFLNTNKNKIKIKKEYNINTEKKR